MAHLKELIEIKRKIEEVSPTYHKLISQLVDEKELIGKKILEKLSMPETPLNGDEYDFNFDFKDKCMRIRVTTFCYEDSWYEDICELTFDEIEEKLNETSD